MILEACDSIMRFGFKIGLSKSFTVTDPICRCHNKYNKTS